MKPFNEETMDSDTYRDFQKDQHELWAEREKRRELEESEKEEQSK